MRTPEEQAEWEQRYYGCSIADLRKSLASTVAFIERERSWERARAANTALVAMLDDVLAMIAAGELRDAGIYVNRVRLVIDEAGPIKLWESKQ